MDDATRTQIVMTAVTAAGPAGDDALAWQVRVAEQAARIVAMTSPEHAIAKVVAGMSNSKVFTGTVLRVDKEASSTRGLVTLKTRVHAEYAPDGIEKVRTDRTDNPYGMAMARRLRSLTGHRVTVWVEIEKMANGSGKTTRVVRHVEDLGVDEDAAQVA